MWHQEPHFIIHSLELESPLLIFLQALLQEKD